MTGMSWIQEVAPESAGAALTAYDERWLRDATKLRLEWVGERETRRREDP